MKTVYKKRTLKNFIQWYEKHIKAGKISTEQKNLIRVKFYEYENKLN